MKIKEALIAIAAIFLIFLIFFIAREQKEAGRNEIKVEQLEDKNTQNQAVIENQKKTNEVQKKQQKIISNLDVDLEYRIKWLQWHNSNIAANSNK